MERREVRPEARVCTDPILKDRGRGLVGGGDGAVVGLGVYCGIIMPGALE